MKVKLIMLHDFYLLSLIGLMKIADGCSFLRLNDYFARLAAFAAFQFERRRRRLKEWNLSRTLELSKVEIRNVVKKSIYEFWYDVFSPLQFRNRKPVQKGVEVRGLERLQEALRNGKGIILWESTSFGRRVSAKRILQENGFSVCQVHGENHMGGWGFANGGSAVSWTRRHIIRPLFENFERSFVREIIYLNGTDSLAFTRALAERLKRNEIICIGADGGFGHKFIPVKFLGRTDFFPTGMVSLAKLSGATIFPLFCIQGSGDRTTVIIESPIRLEIDKDRESCLEKAVSEYASLLESYVKKYPEQYRNWHLLES
jgi:lauroyl/myristoyl acyltransferase